MTTNRSKKIKLKSESQSKNKFLGMGIRGISP